MATKKMWQATFKHFLIFTIWLIFFRFDVQWKWKNKEFRTRSRMQTCKMSCVVHLQWLNFAAVCKRREKVNENSKENANKCCDTRITKQTEFKNMKLSLSMLWFVDSFNFVIFFWMAGGKNCLATWKYPHTVNDNFFFQRPSQPHTAYVVCRPFHSLWT